MESEVFLLGHWKNYDELESNLSMEELIITLNASREKELRDRRFFAALQGIDIDDDKSNNSGSEEIAPDDDITWLKGYKASEAGFGIGNGLGYVQVGG